MKLIYLMLTLFLTITETLFAGDIQDSNHIDQKYTGYVPTKAVVLGHKSIPNGGRRRRSSTDFYTIEFQTQNGEWKESSSVSTIGNGWYQVFSKLTIGDTIEVYYNPADEDDVIVDEYEYSTSVNRFDYRNLLFYGIIGLIVLISSYSAIKKFYLIITGKYTG